MFLDSKTIARTFNALEAKLGTKKPKEKDTMKLLQSQQLHDSRKTKSKLKVKDGLPKEEIQNNCL